MLTLIYALVFSSFAISGEGNKILVYADSTGDVVFKVSSESENQLHVSVQGNFDETASLSIVSTRGTALFYEFIEDFSRDFNIDVSRFEKGVYYVKLSFDGEIRLKTIVIK